MIVTFGFDALVAMMVLPSPVNSESRHHEQPVLSAGVPLPNCCGGAGRGVGAAVAAGGGSGVGDACAIVAAALAVADDADVALPLVDAARVGEGFAATIADCPRGSTAMTPKKK